MLSDLEVRFNLMPGYLLSIKAFYCEMKCYICFNKVFISVMVNIQTDVDA